MYAGAALGCRPLQVPAPCCSAAAGCCRSRAPTRRSRGQPRQTTETETETWCRDVTGPRRWEDGAILTEGNILKSNRTVEGGMDRNLILSNLSFL